MKTYKRILAPVFSDGQSELLLRRVKELTQTAHAQVLVLRVLDTRSGFAPDGPAAAFPEEAAMRRAADSKKRLELQLARYDLAWAEARVAWGEPAATVSEVARAWQPDLVVTCGTRLPRDLAEKVDVLTVGRASTVGRWADALFHSAFRHA
ncbi:MAG: universal stress protein [Betaproteobacteria bacterium]|nr:universal stress protein [Betaproteobacteria bacterium]